MKQILIVAIISAAIGGYLVYRYLPQTETISKDHIVTIIKRIKYKNGTEVTDEKRTEEKKESSKETQKANEWFIAGTVYSQPRVYGISINKKILGPISVGLTATTEKQIGLNVGVEF